MRLNSKILLSVALVVLVVGGAFAYAVLHLQRRAGLRQVELAARTLASTIYHGLESSMIRNNPDEIQEILVHLRGEPMVRRIEILTPAGRAWSSSEAGAIGGVRESPDLARVLASGEPLVREEPSAGEILALQPVLNQSSCAPCHSGDPVVLGAVSVSLDTRRLSSEAASSAPLLAGLVVAATVVSIAILGLLLSRFLLAPLAALVNGVQRLARGDFGARVRWTSRDEIGLLVTAFNDMAERIQRHTAGLDREIGQLTRWLSGLRLFGRTLAETRELEQSLAEVVEETARLARADACVLSLMQPPSERTFGDPSPRGDDAGAAAAVRMEIPLTVQDRRTGTLVVVRRSGPPFSPEDVTVLEAISNLVAIAVENLRLFQEVADKERLRGRLLTRVLGAQEDERRRIARELHDSVGQALTGLLLRVDLALQALPQEATELAHRLEDLRRLADGTLEEVRRITYDLRPAALDDLNLEAAIHWYARSHLEPAGLVVSVQSEGCTERRLDPMVEIALFRVAQEAITNVLRHANARHATVRLSCGPDGSLGLVVEDDGRGFDVEEVRRRTDRPPLGLTGMQERVETLGGTLVVESATGRGTRVEAHIPKRAAAPG